jgi:DNA polymerase-1
MAADIIKQAMINVFARLQKRGLRTRMLLQVHDELVFEVPEDELSDAAALVVAEMESAASLSVPLKADWKWGRAWGDMTTVDSAETAVIPTGSAD